MKWAKTILIVVVVVALMVSIAGCNKTNVAEGNGKTGQEQMKSKEPQKLKNPEINVLRIVISGNMPVPDEVDQILADKYGARVNYIESTGNEVNTKLFTMINSGDSPDVVFQTMTMPGYAMKGLGQPIDPYLDMTDPLINTKATREFLFNGKHYLVCPAPQIRVMYYNETLFDNNGIKTPIQYYKEGKWDWNTMRELAAKFSHRADNNAIVDQWGYAENNNDIWIINNGSQIVNYTGDGDIKLNLNDSKLIDALQLIQDIYYKYNAGSNMQKFLEGRVAMQIHNPAFVYSKDFGKITFNWAIAPCPDSPSGSKDLFGTVGGALGIPVGAKNPEGGAAFITVDVKSTRKQLDSDYKKYFTDEQIEILKTLEGQIVFPKHSGINNMKQVYGQLLNEIKKGQPVVSTVEKYAPLFQQEIDMLFSK